MDWLANLLGGENGGAVQFLPIVAGLVILLVFIIWLFRKIAGRSSPHSAKSDEARLSITDSARVDESRYLVLVKRDDLEHLIMIGGPSDIVIETGIETRHTQKSLLEDEKPQNVGSVKQIAERKDTHSSIDDTPENTTSPATSMAAVAATSTAATAVSENTELAAAETETVSKVEDASVGATTGVGEDLDVRLPDLEQSISAELGEELSSGIETGNETDTPVEPVAASSNSSTGNPPENLEAQISEKLDTVLSDASLGITPASDITEDLSEVPPVTKTQSADEIKTEMQKLLDEVAGIRRSS